LPSEATERPDISGEPADPLAASEATRSWGPNARSRSNAGLQSSEREARSPFDDRVRAAVVERAPALGDVDPMVEDPWGGSRRNRPSRSWLDPRGWRDREDVSRLGGGGNWGVRGTLASRKALAGSAWLENCSSSALLSLLWAASGSLRLMSRR
jgi:hypothetical protein